MQKIFVDTEEYTMINNDLNGFFDPEIPNAQLNDDNGSYEDVFRKIAESGTVTVNKNGKVIYCITVIGQIEGHYFAPQNAKTTKYEHLIPQFLAVEQSEIIDGMFIVLNTVGGDIEAGLALAELIRGMTKPTVSLVLGGGHSIAIPLAVAANTSFIVPSATMTIHPVRTSGLVLGVSQTLDYFMRIQERIVNFVSNNCAISSEKFTSLMNKTGELVMDFGTILDGEKAVSYGIIDRLGNLNDAFTELDRLIDIRKEEN